MIVFTRRQAQDMLFWLKELRLQTPNDLAKIIDDKLGEAEPDWVYLTETEIDEIIDPKPGFSEDEEACAEYVRGIKIALKIEAKVKEKNR